MASEVASKGGSSGPLKTDAPPPPHTHPLLPHGAPTPPHDALRPLQDLVTRPVKRTFAMFAGTKARGYGEYSPASKVRIAVKISDEYSRVKEAVAGVPGALGAAPTTSKAPGSSVAGGGGGGVEVSTVDPSEDIKMSALVSDVAEAVGKKIVASGIARNSESIVAYEKAKAVTAAAESSSRALVARRAGRAVPKPKWHAPWKLMRVISAHHGWVRALCVEPGNKWFATGAADRQIKIFDLASGTLKLTLTGHINCVRGLAVSPRHPYLFSAGEDKQVNCWDLEYNKIIRHYHGHLSGVYALALHPTIDVLVTAGRDSVARVWDMRSKREIHCLAGHKGTVVSVATQSVDPQIITSSMDKTVRLWDLAAGKTMSILTNHKKGVRSLAVHPKQYSFVSGGADNIKKWQCPEGRFIQNLSGHNTILHSMALNSDGVLISGGDDGTLRCWDYDTGYNFQSMETVVQPGSLDAEAGIYSMCFDQTGSRLITGEADKTIKIWKEDPDASETSHPIDMAGWTAEYRKHKRY